MTKREMRQMAAMWFALSIIGSVLQYGFGLGWAESLSDIWFGGAVALFAPTFFKDGK